MKPASKEDLRTKIGVIYGILNVKNGRWYIGQTKHTFYKRYSAGAWWKHTTSLPLYNAYRRYGPQAFEVYLFESDITDDEQRFRLEDKYVKQYCAVFPNGYCFQSGGQQYGKRVSEASRSKMSKSHCRRLAREYVLLDAFEREYRFTNIVSFANQHNINPKQVSNLLRGLCARYGGFHRPGVCLAKFYQDSVLKIVIDPQGNEHSFYNIAAFCREHDLTTTCMERVVSGKADQHKGWQLKTDHVKPIGYRWRNENNVKKKFQCITLGRDGTQYTITNDIRSFCDQHGIKLGDVYALTRGEQKTAHGFYLVSVEYTDAYLVKHPEQKSLTRA